MQKFKDVNGREWSIELNIATIRKLRKATANVEGFEDFDILDYAGVLTRMNDPLFAADLLFLVCRDQLDAAGIDDETFGRSLKGRALFDGVTAFLAEYVDFFPEPTVAEKIATVIEKTRTAQTELADAICRTSERMIREALEDAAKELGALS